MTWHTRVSCIWRRLHVFLRLVPVANFPALITDWSRLLPISRIPAFGPLTYFPAPGTGCVFLFRVPIGSLCFFFSVVVCCQYLKPRFFPQIAEKCHLLGNFNSLKALLAGLQSTPVYRLKETWKEVPSKRKK